MTPKEWVAVAVGLMTLSGGLYATVRWIARGASADYETRIVKLEADVRAVKATVAGQESRLHDLTLIPIQTAKLEAAASAMERTQEELKDLLKTIEQRVYDLTKDRNKHEP